MGIAGGLAPGKRACFSITITLFIHVTPMADGTIHELPPQQRPREKLVARGVAALSDAELIAILLRTGTRGVNVVALAEQLLQRFGSFANLARIPALELAKVKGVGLAKSIQLAASFAVGARLASERVRNEPIDNPQTVYDLLGPEMGLLDRESLRAVLLDAKQRLIAVPEISMGTLNESLAHPREIFKAAITHSAYSFILVHNHPSGDPAPSEADGRLTRRIAEAAKLLQITLHDHVIIGTPQNGHRGYFSFKEAGVIA
jgi:DNA repair protein RadC